MAKKIILFLSGMKEDAPAIKYGCPDGGFVMGRQTNEAPVKYLLSKHTGISEILCILTPDAERSAWSTFKSSIFETDRNVLCTGIPFRQEEDFQAEILPQILSKAKEGDEILLETTGGLRSALMYLLLISRALSYAGIQTIEVIYGNLGKRSIEDISHLIPLFDFIGGMQELSSFGNVRTLREYYRTQPHAPEIDGLLDSTDRLWEAITLCKANRISLRMEQFNQALEAAERCADPLMCALLPVFRKKFGKKLNVPGLIKWCVQSDMLQQALTVYKERIPVYLMADRPDILRVPPETPEPEMHRDYVSVEEARFYEHFLKMSRNMGKVYRGYGENSRFSLCGDYTVATLEQLDTLLPHSYFSTEYPIDRLRVIVMDYLYIRALRNMINHANDQETASQKQLMGYLNDYGYKRLHEVQADDIRKTILNALDHLRPLSRRERAK